MNEKRWIKKELIKKQNKKKQNERDNDWLNVLSKTR